MELKILQWNVWYRESPANILAQLRKFDADILCLQELTEHSEFNPDANIPALIAEELGFEKAFCVAQAWHDEGRLIRNQGNGIFSKLPIRSSSRHILQKSGGSNPHFDDEERIYIEVEIEVSGKLLTVATAHLSYTDRFAGSAKRDAENSKLLECMGSNRSHYFFAGDLNMPSGGTFIDTLPQVTNLRVASPSYDQNTWTTKPFSYQGFEVDALKYRLDYAFCSTDIELVETKILQTDVSDHLPILTTIKL